MFRLVLIEELEDLALEREDIKRDFRNKVLTLEEANYFLDLNYERDLWVSDAYIYMLTCESPQISLNELNFCVSHGIAVRENWLN